MGCHEFDLDLSLRPYEAYLLGKKIGNIPEVSVNVDDFGIKITDENNVRLPVIDYRNALSDLAGKPRVSLDGFNSANLAESTFTAGLVEAAIFRQAVNLAVSRIVGVEALPNFADTVTVFEEGGI